MKYLKCWFGIHEFGEKYNVREDTLTDIEKQYGSWLILLTFPWLLARMASPPNICDVKCKRCGKVKTITYN
jgi:hypothetical protein